MTLFGVGAVALDSNVWWYASVVLAALGAARGPVAPFGRNSKGRSEPLADDGNQTGGFGDARPIRP